MCSRTRNFSQEADYSITKTELVNPRSTNKPAPAAHKSYRYFPVAKRDRDWGLFITTAGEARIKENAVYPAPGHPKGYDFRAPEGRQLNEYQLIYISAGTGWFKSESTERIKINAGHVILLFPGVWHSYAPTASTGWDEHWVGFDGDLARRLVKNKFFTPDQPVLRAGVEQKLLGLFSGIMDASRDNHPALQQIMAGTTEHMLSFLYSSQQSKLAGNDPGAEIIQLAIARMREVGENPIHVPALAEELKVSYRWFRRAFAHHTGLSPHHYYLELRLANARDLLAQSSLSIKEIAARVGFEDVPYFCKFFRKKVGMAASVWRERTRKR